MGSSAEGVGGGARGVAEGARAEGGKGKGKGGGIEESEWGAGGVAGGTKVRVLFVLLFIF